MGIYFPMFVSLQGKRAVVVGAGRIALRRIRTLAEFGCRITVIAPEALPEICRWEETKEVPITWLKECYSDARLEEICREGPVGLLVAASGSREANHLAGRKAKALGIPANVADCREECDFYFPGIARRGQVVVGVTASGENHRLARQVTEKMREALAAADLPDQNPCPMGSYLTNQSII